MLKLGFLLATAVVALPTTTLAQSTNQRRPVRDVLIADVNNDLTGFLDRIRRIEGVNQRLGLGAELRVFQATFAGAQTGEVYVYWELRASWRLARRKPNCTRTRNIGRSWRRWPRLGSRFDRKC